MGVPMAVRRAALQVAQVEMEAPVERKAAVAAAVATAESLAARAARQVEGGA